MALKHTNPARHRWDKKERMEVTAVAPYNFIPLPEKMVVAQPPPDHDSYQPEPVAYTGWIACELETCSPTYIRGMLTEKQFASFGQAGPDQLTEEQKEAMANFFGLSQDVPLIPGSSLRGMIRQLVEIVGHGRMRYVSPTPTFTYRAVAAQNDDPLREPYREVVGAFARNVRAGILEKRGDAWWIQPTLLPSSLNLAEKGAFLKIKERDIPAKSIPGLYRLNSPDYRPAWHYVSFDVEDRRGKQGMHTAVTRIGAREANHRYEGILVCSGNMMETGDKTNRKNHALILAKDGHARSVQIDPQAVQDYRDGLTPFQEELDAWGGKGWGCLKDGAPIFYVSEGNMVRYFGHSPNFRIPARLNLPGESRAANPRDFVPAHLRENPQPDMADAIFGWVEEREKGTVVGPPGQRAGRVFFSDGRCDAGQENIWLAAEPITPHVLSGPKPTTFQHYLVQDGKAGQNGHHPDNKAALAHYGTPPGETEIRGYKLYWHKGAKPKIEANAVELSHPKQLTRIKPLQAGVRFRFKVHFENLRPEELGLLWWALALPGEAGKQYRHKLGMGKPLGMGAVAITPQLFITDRPARYETLFSGEQWQTGVQTADAQPFLDALNRYLLQEKGLGARQQNITELERIQMLLAMLEWREGSPEWQAKTRYMEIERPTGRRRSDGQPETFNEYKERPVLPNPFGVLSGPNVPGPTPGGTPQKQPQQVQPTKPKPVAESGPRPQSVQPTKPKPAAKSDPQPGDLLQAKVYFLESNGDVYLELAGISPDRMMGYIPANRLGSKQYQEGQAAAVMVLAVQNRGGEMVLECEPTGVSDLQGTVKWFDEHRGYGFIVPDSGERDVYVHKSRLAGVQRLREGERVLFKIGKGMKGLEAQDVRLVDVD
ncbi:MAG: TIGR03986 family CRISPR-associated RAMP protein [Chloroflexi bacterium]|nr:TIGR03986 family CRISPR-associated RAMP protein [Ardenticatenaceae bacterium]NOG33960.1 TIGR03986 family CRISPR-associated RAMP protein [Chloroflexota bacterium]GIK55644.1 MAG: CRISPR-associated RAMP family protein [Chloroflexota bacterium]